MSKPSDHESGADSGVALQELPTKTQSPARPIAKTLRKQASVPRLLPDVDEDGEAGFFARYKVLIIATPLVAAATVGFVFFRHPGTSEPVQKAPEQKMVMIQLPPPPPPPPPPPKVQPPPPKDEKRIEQAPAAKPEAKPEPKPAEKPPEGLGTNVKGNGPGMAGLGTSGNGVIGGTGSGSGGGGSAARWYAGQVQGKISEALRTNPKTRKATLRVDVQVWVDDSGHVTRAVLLGSTGDSALDAAVKDQVLVGVKLSEPPPKGMKMPVALRLIAKRPS